MDKIVIVGSGASGVHFALSLLKKGYEVFMLDVGYEQPETVNPEDNFNDLKNNLSDPVKYFLGQNYEAVIYPDFKSEYYGFPPSKNYVFFKPSIFKSESDGFAPLFSFAKGGLAQAWTGGVYPFNDKELGDFPFSFDDIKPYYAEVANQIGITGVRDDLERFLPYHENIEEPLELDEHSKSLISEYEKHSDYLNNTLKCYFGRSRLATLSRDNEDRKGCTHAGRCLWGCPSKALYTPSITLKKCQKYSNFKYLPKMYVNHFKYNSKRRITSVVAVAGNNKDFCEFPLDKLVLAAGTLSSSKIFMDSIFKNTGEIIKLPGLMDNRQIMMPFVNLRMVGKPYNPESYQYNQIALGIESERPQEYIHGLITTLKTALVHPIIQKMPLDLKTSIFMFRNIHAALGVVNVNLNDSRREDNYLTLETNTKSPYSKLVIKYTPAINETKLIKGAIRKVRKVLRQLGCIAPSSMINIRPMGASVHYSGTIPMSTKQNSFTSSELCRSYDFENLYIVDGTTFPFLPAKNLTFTLMANAVRVADCAF